MGNYENLTIEEKQKLLENDVAFALNFAVDNQPELIISELKAQGSENVVDSETSFNNLVWLYENDKDKLETILGAIPYNDSINNYTGQMGVAESEVQTRSQNKALNWGSLLGVVGTAVAGVGGLLNTQNQGIDPNLAEKRRLEELKRLETEKKSKQTMLIVGGLIVAVLVVVVIMNMGKKSK